MNEVKKKKKNQARENFGRVPSPSSLLSSSHFLMSASVTIHKAAISSDSPMIVVNSHKSELATLSKKGSWLEEHNNNSSSEEGRAPKRLQLESFSFFFFFFQVRQRWVKRRLSPFFHFPAQRTDAQDHSDRSFVVHR
jgi:hypothetical protein